MPYNYVGIIRQPLSQELFDALMGEDDFDSKYKTRPIDMTEEEFNRKKTTTWLEDMTKEDKPTHDIYDVSDMD